MTGSGRKTARISASISYNNVLDFIETDGTAMGKHSMQLLTDLIKGTLIIED